jgi:hypothetical protein
VTDPPGRRADEAMPAIEVAAHPESRVHNSQPHGIGRVAAFGGIVAWNNLGRNVVFAGTDLRAHAVFDESAFAEDEPSQYDLDIHAILDGPGPELVVTVNHYGMVRAFRRSDVCPPHDGGVRRVAPIWTRTFVADVERLVVAGGRLVGSRPRDEGRSGLLVSDLLGADAPAARLSASVTLGDERPVRALAALTGTGAVSVAVGGDGHVGVATLDQRGVGTMRWEAEVAFEPAVILWDGDLVWVGGSEAGVVVDDYDWEARRGGGFAALDPADGRVVVAGRFPDEVAWGTGGVALALVPGALCALGRRGERFVFDRRDGTTLAATAPTADASLGIAHCAAIGDRVLYGFNRGDYQLWTTIAPPAAGRRTA